MPGLAWRAMVLVLPRGTGLDYDAATIDVVPTWSFTPMAGGGEFFATRGKIWAKVHPDLSQEDYQARRRNQAEQYRVELFRAVEAVHGK